MFRVGIKRGEDLDLWLRIALNYDVAYLNLPKVFYRTGLSDSLTSDYSKNGEFPYYEWFNFTSESSYYRKYVILVVYIHAKNAFIHHDYDTCLAELWSVKNYCLEIQMGRAIIITSNFMDKKVNNEYHLFCSQYYHCRRYIPYSVRQDELFGGKYGKDGFFFGILW